MRGVDVPSFPAWSSPRARYVLADFLETQRSAGYYPQRRDRYGPEVASYLRHAEYIAPADRSAAADELDRLAHELRAGIGDVDAVILPTTPVPAPRIADCGFTDREQGRATVVETLMRLCGPFSWCGFAAVTVPGGIDVDGLPIGVQIAASEVSTVLAVAIAYQQHTAHHLAAPRPISVPER